MLLCGSGCWVGGWPRMFPSNHCPSPSSSSTFILATSPSWRWCTSQHLCVWPWGTMRAGNLQRQQQPGNSAAPLVMSEAETKAQSWWKERALPDRSHLECMERKSLIQHLRKRSYISGSIQHWIFWNRTRQGPRWRKLCVWCGFDTGLGLKPYGTDSLWLPPLAWGLILPLHPLPPGANCEAAYATVSTRP